MQYRKLGKKGPMVSSLGLGCMGISEMYGPGDERAGIEVVRQAYADGVTFFDTADMYGRGANELFLGKAVQPFRDRVVIATKCGIERIGETMRFNNTPSYIRAACEGSLKRLNMEHVDVYYLHRYDSNVPIEESMGVMLQLIQEGKILYVGLSEVDGAIVERAHRVLQDKLVAVQSEYSLVNRAAAEVVLPTCRRLGIAFVPFSPIARGLLSGRIRLNDRFDNNAAFDFRSVHPQFQPEALKANMQLIDAVHRIASHKHCTPAQLSLAWLLAQGEDIIPIPGTKRLTYLKENLGALAVRLTPADLTALDEAMNSHPVQGGRYPEEILEIAYLKF